MKGTIAILGEVRGIRAAAFLRDGQLDDLLIDAPDDRIRPGAIFRARATRPMKGQGGLILSSPMGPLFYRQAKGIASGKKLIVQASTHADAGTATSQAFPADAFTAELVPAAATNTWTVELVPGELFAYQLRRAGTDRRFRVEFDLSEVTDTPPPPWGAN